ncbi:hypothetical protein [Sphingobium sp. LSP13-1-1.1]|uniref:hypothetical protein n=1 Tax=Sphingobium sp. LSP13-1-1.1 TaxID=3135234 RepID=UPI00343181FE
MFIGYSMPAADFEFKHLLKRVQLTEGDRPDITVITGGTLRWCRQFGQGDKLIPT